MRTKNLTRLIRGGLLLAAALSVFFVIGTAWRVFITALLGTVVVLLLQELVEPAPLFWTVPLEAIQLIVSRRVRLNHFWLHRSTGLIRELSGYPCKLDGFATCDGYVLLGAPLTEGEIKWAARVALKVISGRVLANRSAKGCKTTRFLFALCLLIGGIVALTIWRGRVDLATALLLSVVCGAAGHGLARPVERLFGPWAASISLRDERMDPARLEVEPFAIPDFLWSKGGRGFRVRFADRDVTLSGAST